MADNENVIELAQAKTDKLMAELEAQLEVVKSMLDSEFGADTTEEKLAS